MTQIQVHTPEHIPNASKAANLILQLLKHEVDSLDPNQLDHTFFSVLADFEAQAAAAGLPLEDNIFRRLSDELVDWVRKRTLAQMQAPDVPPEFAQEMGRFRHMTFEARHQPGMLIPAVRLLESVLARIDPQAYPDFRAAVCNDLGATYADLQVADRHKALLRALECYRAALEYRTLERTPLEHAATQYNLGNAYLHLPVDGDGRRQALSDAVAAFRIADRLIARAAAPRDYAVVNLGLGLALALLSAPDGPKADTSSRQLFDRARVHFDRALGVFTEAAYPPGWALAQRHLGAAHYFGAGSAAKAIDHLSTALRVYTRDDAAYEHAALHVQLALAWLAVDDRLAAREAGAAVHAALPFLQRERSNQQQAQLVSAFGAPFASFSTASRRAALAAEVSRLAVHLDRRALRKLTRAQLGQIVADPVRAASHAAAALDTITQLGG